MKKASNKKIKIELIILLIALVGIFALLSFFIKDELVARFSLWGSLIFGCGSIIVAISSLFVSVIALDNTKKEKNERIGNEAKNFIIDHEKEIDYIPLCLIARAFNNHHRYLREIYNDFNKLNKEIQVEVLKQLNYEYKLIESNDWIDLSLKEIEKFIKDNDLGKSYLYDGAKYYHRAFKSPEIEYSEKDEYIKIFPDTFRYLKKYHFENDNKVSVEMISFDDYLASYLNMKRKNDPLYILNKDKKPIDYLYSLLKMNEMDDCDFAFWMMVVVDCVAYSIMRENNNFDFGISKGDAEIQNYEDRYLLSLMVLYNLSSVKNND